MKIRATIMTLGFEKYALLILVALGAAWLAPAAARAAGEAEAEGQRIVRVVVRGNERVNTHRILGQMRLREGSAYSPAAVDEDLKRIYDLHEFDDVVIRPEQEDEGLVLVVEVTERPILGRLEFMGNHHFSDKDLAETIGLAAGDKMDRHRIFTGAGHRTEISRRGLLFCPRHAG